MIRPVTLAIGVLVALLAYVTEAQGAPSKKLPPSGGPLSRANVTPLPTSTAITGARWLTGRYDPPNNQWGDILPTVWSNDGGTYVMMDDGGVDVPWRADCGGSRSPGSPALPPNLRFRHVGDPTAPAPRTWAQIGGNPDNDDGPLGPYYSIGFAEAGGIFYATQQRNWNWPANGPFTGLAGIAYSTRPRQDLAVSAQAVPRPARQPDVRRRRRPRRQVSGRIHLRDRHRARVQRVEAAAGPCPARGRERDRSFPMAVVRRDRAAAGARPGVVELPVSAATPVLSWNSHITYPEMTYDAGSTATC